jgi:hypothetical protein
MTKERVVERVRTVVKGKGGCCGGGDAPFPSTTALFIDRTPLCEIKKVTASQDDDFVGACNIAVWLCRKDERAKKSQALGMTKEEHLLMESGYRRRF